MAGQSRRGKQPRLPRGEVIHRIHHPAGSHDREPPANSRRSALQDSPRTGGSSKIHRPYCYIELTARQRQRGHYRRLSFRLEKEC